MRRRYHLGHVCSTKKIQIDGVPFFYPCRSRLRFWYRALVLIFMVCSCICSSLHGQSPGADKPRRKHRGESTFKHVPAMHVCFFQSIPSSLPGWRLPSVGGLPLHGTSDPCDFGFTSPEICVVTRFHPVTRV